MAGAVFNLAVSNKNYYIKGKKPRFLEDNIPNLLH